MNLEMREERGTSELSDEIYRNWIRTEFFRVSLPTGSFLAISEEMCLLGGAWLVHSRLAGRETVRGTLRPSPREPWQHPTLRAASSSVSWRTGNAALKHVTHLSPKLLFVWRRTCRLC